MVNPPDRFHSDPQFEADMMALLESDAMNKLAAYAARGRSHLNLSEQQLTDACVNAGAKMHRLAGTKIHQCAGEEAPHWGLFRQSSGLGRMIRRIRTGTS
jgi:hypothetical protein